MRIGNAAGLSAQHSFQRSMDQFNLSSVRLATMQRINSAADDPAGLVAAESLRAELEAINAAADNAARAGGVVRTADSALAEVSSLLNTVRGNVVAGASDGRSDVERAALQLENDAALEAIDRISRTTSFGGNNPLQGGDLTFAISPDVGNTTSVTLPEISTASLGDGAASLRELAAGGSSSLVDGDPSQAISILDAASNQVTAARGQLGAFEKQTLGSSRRVLEGMQANVTAAFGAITDTNVAAETSRLARSQILADSSLLSIMFSGRNRSMLQAII